MRKRLFLAAAVAVAAVLLVVPVAWAHHRPKLVISQPGIVGRHIKANQEFKVKGFVWPRQSEDTTRMPAVVVYKWVKGAKPRYSFVETMPATFGWPSGKTWNSYETSLTLADAGCYRLKAVLLDGDGNVLVKSPPRPLMVKDPNAPKPLFVSMPGSVDGRVVAAQEFGVVGFVAPQLSDDTTLTPVIQVFEVARGRHGSCERPAGSQVDTVTASWAGKVGARATSYEASVTIATPGCYALKTAVLDGDGNVVARSMPALLFVGDPNAPHGPQGPHH